MDAIHEVADAVRDEENRVTKFAKLRENGTEEMVESDKKTVCRHSQTITDTHPRHFFLSLKHSQFSCCFINADGTFFPKSLFVFL